MQGQVADREGRTIRVDEVRHHIPSADWYEFPYINPDCDFEGWHAFGEPYWEASDGWMVAMQGMLAGDVIEMHRGPEVYWFLVRKVRYEQQAGAGALLIKGARLQHAKWGVPQEEPLDISRIISVIG